MPRSDRINCLRRKKKQPSKTKERKKQETQSFLPDFPLRGALTDAPFRQLGFKMETDRLGSDTPKYEMNKQQ